MVLVEEGNLEDGEDGEERTGGRGEYGARTRLAGEGVSSRLHRVEIIFE